MQIKSEIDEKYTEIEVHVCHEKMNEEVKSVMGQLHAPPARSSGSKNQPLRTLIK